MNNKSNKSNMTNRRKNGGYESLVVYWLATTIYDLNQIFIDRYIEKRSRTYDQMLQAARSGKQNIVEGSLSLSVESNIKLTSVARASFGELLEDYRDYLRGRKLSIWEKDDSKVVDIRRTRDIPYKTYTSYTTYMSYMTEPEGFGNLMVTLCYKQGYLMDQFLRGIEQRFIREGGFREKLLRKRIEYRNR